MLRVTAEISLLCCYWLLGPAFWSFYGVMLYAGQRKLLLMQRPGHPINVSPLPSVIIFIPAKDEGERIRNCLASALAQDYAMLRVVAINDRSTDFTGAVMDEMAAADPRLSVLHITTPPAPGWTGKNNALFSAAKDAQADWFLFVDSDVVLEPDAVRIAMSVVLRKEFDLLSLLPRLESYSAWESLLVPLAGSAASTLYLIALTNNSKSSKNAFANGQFLLINRSSYLAIGGHETVRDRYCEDVEIASLMKERGLRPRVTLGNDFASVRMYSSLSAIFRGWSRIFYAARVGSPRPVLTGIAAILLSCFPVYPALGWGLYRLLHTHDTYGQTMGFVWFTMSLSHLLTMTWLVSRLYLWSGNPRRNALLLPVGLFMLLLIFLQALKMCITKKVEWRGTSYAHNMARDLNVAPVTQPSGMQP